MITEHYPTLIDENLIIDLYETQNPIKSQYVKLIHPHITISYAVDVRIFNQRVNYYVTRDKIPPDANFVRHLENSDEIVASVKDALNKANINLLKISERIKWEAKGSGIDLLIQFEKWIPNNNVHVMLDLSKLDLTSLPYNISLFTNVKVLDLSHNKLYMFPKELEQLTNLEEINITDNSLWEDPPAWIKERNIRVVDLTAETASSPWAQPFYNKET